MGTTAYIFYASCSCINLYSNMGVVVIPACVHFGCYALSFLWRCRQRYLEIEGLIGCMIANFLATCIEFCFPYVKIFFFISFLQESCIARHCLSFYLSNILVEKIFCSEKKTLERIELWTHLNELRYLLKMRLIWGL